MGNADWLATHCLIYELLHLLLLTHYIGNLGKEGEQGEGAKEKETLPPYTLAKESYCTGNGSPPE